MSEKPASHGEQCEWQWQWWGCRGTVSKETLGKQNSRYWETVMVLMWLKPLTVTTAAGASQCFHRESHLIVTAGHRHKKRHRYKHLCKLFWGECGALTRFFKFIFSLTQKFMHWCWGLTQGFSHMLSAHSITLRLPFNVNLQASRGVCEGDWLAVKWQS